MFKEQGLKKEHKKKCYSRMLSPLTDTAVKKETRVSSPLMLLSISIHNLIKCSLDASSWVPAPLYSGQKICVQAIWKSQLLNQISYLTLILFFRHAT